MDDNGIKVRSRPNENYWRTFVKATMYCTNEVNDKTFGMETFYYNRISTSVNHGS